MSWEGIYKFDGADSNTDLSYKGKDDLGDSVPVEQAEELAIELK